MIRKDGGFFDRLRQSLEAKVRKLRRSIVGFDHRDLARLSRSADAPPRATDANGFAALDSLGRLQNNPHLRNPLFAVVSVLPPQVSGIADFSFRVLQGAEFDVDVYFPHADLEEYFLVTRRFFGGKGHIEAFSLSIFDAGLNLRKYQRVIWVLGNSLHHVPVARLMRQGVRFPIKARQWLHIHDPMMPALVSHLALDRTAGECGPGRVGVGRIAEGLDLERCIVHSEAARQWLEADGMRSVDVLFHPVFDSFEQKAPPVADGEIRMGSFGMPSATKGSHLVINAFREIRSARPQSTLVLAGYLAGDYARQAGILNEPGLLIEDSPTPARFLELMRSVDVAVQLRLSNEGESSGAIPQLLSRDVPVITSPVGAFLSYGATVRYFDASEGSAALAQAVLDERDTAVARSDARRAFVAAHSSQRFCADLKRLALG
ncbi:hypothetical protein [Xanthobacter autotrophicus]|uniref:hypothetical protein n=1 Tax=Xanthobacter autotrophicus TaxID=280 RepID=UPI0024A68193|nr:hypothetical protein [Xanthobacter autotrophicus]MDI4654876.1 hypothetical protein [Xanthobacter autotrophicus]